MDRDFALRVEEGKRILIIIDPIKVLKNEISAPAFMAMQEVLDEHSDKFDKIIITQFCSDKDSLHIVDQKCDKFLEEKYPENVKIALSIPKHTNRKIIKTSVDGKMNSEEFKKEIISLNPKSVFMMGVATEYAILDTARGFADLKIQPIMIEEGCGSYNKGGHEKGLDLINKYPGLGYTVPKEKLPSYL